MKKEVGIDLGTSNSLVALIENGKIKPIKFSRSDMLPSVLYYDGR